MVVILGFAVYAVVYNMSYDEMINMLEQTVLNVVEYIDDEIEVEYFEQIKSFEDMDSDAYLNAHSFLNDVRTLSGAKYLYLAVENDEEELIYHVDGLSYGDPDFRNVGDLIEPEFQEPLLVALNDNIVMPDDILNTEWGDVFIAYYPIHNHEGSVVAALGIEFPADSQYLAFQRIKYIVSLFIVIACILSGALAHILFKKISNPYLKNIYTTDSLTKLKNRTAFDVDIHNGIIQQSLAETTLVYADLNGLKLVNDKKGHKMGDYYIQSCAKALLLDDMGHYLVYRIGGDEFAIIFPTNDANVVESYISSVKVSLKEICNDLLPEASVSMGYAICNNSSMEAWKVAQREADANMYEDKKRFYEKNKELDGRKINS